MHTIYEWMEHFSAAVQNRDFAAGRSLFENDVLAFGSVQSVCRGLDALEQSQWRNVWGRTSGYHIDLAAASSGEQGDLGWAAATWSSSGQGSGENDRRGRVTFVLRRRSGVWRAVHSHHSFDPQTDVRR